MALVGLVALAPQNTTITPLSSNGRAAENAHKERKYKINITSSRMHEVHNSRFTVLPRAGAKWPLSYSYISVAKRCYSNGIVLIAHLLNIIPVYHQINLKLLFEVT